MRITEALKEIIANLEAVGLAATGNPSRVQLPGALVLPGVIAFGTLDREVKDVEFLIYLLSNNAPDTALTDLETALDKFRSVYEIGEARPVSLPLPNYPEPRPALQISLSLRLTKD